MSLSKMLKVVMAGMLSLTVSSAAYAQITGAGATFPYPLYAKWAEGYNAAHNIRVNYQSIGSGGGIKQIKARTVDFGATDMPLKPADLEAAGLLQFPAVMGGVVPVVNVAGIAPGQLKLSGEVLGGIYAGRIKRWNDPEIAQLNPGLTLPNSTINPIYRSDGSGTTFLFTDYLSKASSEFKAKIGAATAVKWPVGMGGKGNEGVAANVQRIRNSIGYVESAYAKNNRIAHVQLRNLAGEFVQPEEASFQAAAANVDWANTPGFSLMLTNQAGKASWPITGASFVLIHKTTADPAKAEAVLRFFDWSFSNGDALASSLEYVAMPDSVVAQIRATWKQQVKDANGNPVWK